MKTITKHLEAKTVFIFKKRHERVDAMSDPTATTASNNPTCPTVTTTTGIGIR